MTKTNKDKKLDKMMESIEKKVLHMSKKDARYAEALIGTSVLATMVGAGVYYWQQYKAAEKMSLLKKIKINVLTDVKKAGQSISQEWRHLTGRK